MEQKLQVRELYRKARNSAEKNNAVEARVHLLAAINIFGDLYHKSNNIMEKAKMKSLVMKWAPVSAELHANGVSAIVDEFFDIIRTESTVKPPTEGNGTSQGLAADIFKLYKNGIGCIRTPATMGTGFVISENGYLLTNHHIVFDKLNNNCYDTITISFAEKNEQHYLNVEVSDDKLDIALCSFKNRDAYYRFEVIPRIKNYSGVEQGADIIVIGNTLSKGLAPFPGTIKYVCDEHGNLVYTAPSNPGDSGGPVFIRSGECIGINKSATTAYIKGDEIVSVNGMTNATPMNRIDAFLEPIENLFAAFLV